MFELFTRGKGARDNGIVLQGKARGDMSRAAADVGKVKRATHDDQHADIGVGPRVATSLRAVQEHGIKLVAERDC